MITIWREPQFDRTRASSRDPFEALSAADQISQELATESRKSLAFAGLMARSRHDAVRNSREGQTLQVDSSRSGDFRQEQAFTAEEGVREAANELDVIIDAGREGDQAACVDA
jgi:hypothetical protein